MKLKSQKDFWSGLMFVVAGVVFAWGATNYSLGSADRPGPGYFPLGLGLLLALLGALVLFKSLTIETEDGEPIGPFAWRPLIVVIVAIVGFGALLPRAGMVISLPLLIIAVSLAGQEFRLRDVLISAVVLTGGSWAVFIKGLGLSVPVWPVIAG